MEMLNLLKDRYGLADVTWKDHPSIINSSSGCKKIRFWTDKNLLLWHTAYRDEAGKKDSPFLDRMIRTIKGESSVPFQEKWLTLHDCSEEPYDMIGFEKDWGALLSKLLTAGQKNYAHMVLQPDASEFDFQSLLDFALPLTKTSSSLSMIRLSLAEARKRTQQALSLIRLADGCEPPVLNQEISTKNGWKVLNFLFFEAGAGVPVRSFEPLKQFLQEWIASCGSSSLKKLLTEVNKGFPLHEEQGLLLTAEIMMPKELDKCIRQLQTGGLEETVLCMDRFAREWELNRRLLMAVTEWMDDNRKKVAL
ncbi:hypothetical protein ACFQPF_06200 [Fictibacillus iocasae]|uniref:DUF4123 domain-containing protein n=1 Tax=Fictibacillus iocasae TaxID=2715437 RepID=A0ABW2NP35_9BACL